MKRWWRQIAWERIGLAAWLYAFIANIAVQRVDPDFGWHYRSGEYILAHGVPAHDVFTYTARDFLWVNHEWLNDVLMYAVSHWLGYFWLGLLFAALWTGAIWLAAGRRLSWVTAGLALGACVMYLGIRGISWTVLGLALVLWIIQAGRRRYWWLPGLFLVWANVHAGFAIGLAMIALAAVMKRDKQLALWGVVSAAASLINPYGWGVYLELWRTMSDGKLAGYIVEWAPLSVNRTVMPYVLAVIVMLMLTWRWKFERVRSAGLVVAALWSNRHVPLLVIGSIGVLDGEIRRALMYAQARFRWLPVALAVVVGVGFPIALLILPSTVDRGVRLARPTRVLQALKDRPCQGHVFNDYSYGGLMVLALPGVPDYIDGRMPSWSGPQGRYLDRYVEVLKGESTTAAEFERYSVKCAFISKLDTKLVKYLETQPEWRLELRAQDADLWRRD